MDNPRMTPEAIAQDAMDHVADWAARIEDQYALAKTLLKWEGEAAEVLDRQFKAWLLDTLSAAPLQQGHPADELTRGK